LGLFGEAEVKLASELPIARSSGRRRASALRAKQSHEAEDATAREAVFEAENDEQALVMKHLSEALARGALALARKGF